VERAGQERGAREECPSMTVRRTMESIANCLRHREGLGNSTGILGAAEYKCQSVEENGETLAQERSNIHMYLHTQFLIYVNKYIKKARVVIK